MQGLLLVVALGFAAGAYFRLFSGDPMPYLGGGWLRGDVVTQPVRDWSFIPKQQHNLDVERRAGWLPYSGSPWFLVHEKQLYLLLPNLFGDDLKRRIDEDPELRVRIEGKIYLCRATRVDGGVRLASMLSPFLRRLMAVEISGPVRRRSSGLDADVWVYRLESRSG